MSEDSTPKALKPALKPRSRAERRRPATIELYALVSSGFIWACGQYIMAPVLPYFAMAKGANALEYSMISSAYAFSQMISCPLLGLLSDSNRVGRRPVLLAGLAATAVGYLAMSRVETAFQLLLARGALGFSSGTVAAEVAYLADLTAKEERQSWLSLQTTLQLAGSMLGPAIGGFLADHFAKQIGHGTGFEHLCFLIAALCTLNFIIGAIFFTCPTEIKVARPADTRTPLLSVLRKHFLHRTTGLLLAAAFLDSFALAVSDGPEAYFLRDKFGFVPGDQALFLTIAAAASMTSSEIVRYMPEAWPARLVCVVFSLGSAAAMLLPVICREWWIPYAYSALFGFTVTVVEVSSKTKLLSALVPEELQGTVFGIQNALLNVGYSVGPLVGGSMYDYTRHLPYALSSIFLCLSAAVYSSLPSSTTLLASEPLLNEESEALQHMGNKAPLPGKRIGASTATRRARVFFVCPDLYSEFEERNAKTNQFKARSKTIGEASFAMALANQRAGREIVEQSPLAKATSHATIDAYFPH